MEINPHPFLEQIGFRLDLNFELAAFRTALLFFKNTSVTEFKSGFKNSPDLQ